jgi:hypothetical protein
MRDMFVDLLAYGAACLLCVIPLNFVLAGAYLVLAAGDGMPLLDRMVQQEHPGAPGAFFSVSIGVWAAATWYSAHLLLEMRPVATLAIWLPRSLGALIYLPLAAHFVGRGQAWQALAVAAIAAAWLACIVKWRRPFEDEPEAPQEDGAGPGTKTAFALLAGLTAVHALLVGYLLSKAALPRFTDVAPVVLLAFASWTLVGSLVYTLLPKSCRLI